MKIFLLAYFVLHTIFNSWSQTDTISFIHNGYEFQTDIKTLVDYLMIEEDSLEIYTRKLREIISNNPKFNSDSIIPLLGDTEVGFIHILWIFDRNHTLVKIKRISDNQIVRYKVKTMKKVNPYKGLGGSSETTLIIIDKKYRKEIVLEVVRKNLAC